MHLGDCCTIENAIKFGRYRRSSDCRLIQRFRCKSCEKTFSHATFDPAYFQKKRHLNYPCMMLLASNVSLRRASKILNINVKTVARKLLYCGEQARRKLSENRPVLSSKDVIQFDELQTIEHTKLKPVSVAMSVLSGSRKILGLSVSRIPATGHLAAMSRKKYGPRPDERVKGLRKLLKSVEETAPKHITIDSDEAVIYKPLVKRYFPQATYRQFKGEKSRNSGQGELKKGARDPLFSINHTFAMCRANINRLIRKTWCTTKRIDRLEHHLWIYAWVHNSQLTPC